MRKTLTTIAIAAGIVGATVAVAPIAVAATNVHEAPLAGAAGFTAVKGKAKFSIDDGVRRLEAQIENALSLKGAALFVRIDGTLAGRITAITSAPHGSASPVLPFRQPGRGRRSPSAALRTARSLPQASSTRRQRPLRSDEARESGPQSPSMEVGQAVDLFSEGQLERLEKVARSCPLRHSIEAGIEFVEHLEVISACKFYEKAAGDQIIIT